MESSLRGLASQLAFLVPALAVAFDFASTIILSSASRTRQQARQVASFTSVMGLWSLSIAAKARVGFVDDFPIAAQLLNFPVLVVPAAWLSAVAFLTGANDASGRRIVRFGFAAAAMLCLLQTQNLVFSGFHTYPGGTVASAGPAYSVLGLTAVASLCGAIFLGIRACSVGSRSRLRSIRAKYCCLANLLFLPLGAANYMASRGSPILPLSSVFNILVVALFVRASFRHGVLVFRQVPLRLASVGATLLSLGLLAAACESSQLGSFLIGASTAPLALLWLGEARVARLWLGAEFECGRLGSPRQAVDSLAVLPVPWQALNSTVGTALAGASFRDPTSGIVVYLRAAGHRWFVRAGSAGEIRTLSRLPAELISGAARRYRWNLVEPIQLGDREVGVIACSVRASIQADSEVQRPWLRLMASDLERELGTAGEKQGADAVAPPDAATAEPSLPILASRPLLSIHERAHGMVGSSPQFMRCLADIEAASRDIQPVLILGETGTGKELIAHAVHALSSRSKMPFVVVNCPAVPDDLAEVELFGCVRGAFTGATDARVGRFELANGGTVFLDEVADLSIRVQTKLLRVLETQEIQRLGSEKTDRIDFRIVAATNRNIEEAVIEGTFRADLYYRLCGFDIQVPSLRARGFVDVAQLAFFFAERACDRMHLEFGGIEDQALKVLGAYHWPGNIRELERVMERASARACEHPIGLQHLPPGILGVAGSTQELRKSVVSTAPATVGGEPGSLRSSMRDEKSRRLNEALAAAGGNQSAAALALGMSRSNLSRMLKRYGIRSPRSR